MPSIFGSGVFFFVATIYNELRKKFTYIFDMNKNGGLKYGIEKSWPSENAGPN